MSCKDSPGSKLSNGCGRDSERRANLQVRLQKLLVIQSFTKPSVSRNGCVCWSVVNSS